MKMGKIRNYIQLRLISIALLISILIADYIFCSILDKWFELCLIFNLFIYFYFDCFYCILTNQKQNKIYRSELYCF